MENLTGKQFGPYQIIAPLGEGGMAAVYKAYQPGMERYVALKVLPQPLATEPEFVGRFEQEAKVLAKLQHPHILPVFDFGESEGYTYIVMPFLESGTLTNLMHGKPLPLPQIVSVISQVGDALDYAHSRGLVHRDVKPSNVLVDERGNCLLTDFGIAKILEGTSKFTGTGSVIGTPAYMSPEQGRGLPSDGRSDIYSLGIVLYEMATGRVPFTAETPIAVIFKHIQDPLPLPRALNPNLSEEVENVILKALTKQPEDRFATAGDMVKALQAVAANAQHFTPPSEVSFTSVPTVPHPVTTKPVSRDTESQRSEKIKSSTVPPKAASHKWAYVVGGVLLLAGVIGLVVMNGVSRATSTKAEATTTPQPTQTAISAAVLPSNTPLPTLTSPPTTSPTLEPTDIPPETPIPTATPVPATSTPSCATVTGVFATTWAQVRNGIGCSIGTVTSGLVVEENFQFGKMLWREQIDYGQAVVLFSNGTWRIFQHAPYAEGSPEYPCADANTPAQSPPTPRRGFGTMWCDIPAIRNGLGNATDVERGFTGSMQQFDNGFMIETDYGANYIFYSSGTWERK